MFLKRFFYASASLLMLALAYHFGAGSAIAQAPGNSVVAMDGTFIATANGDVYSGSGISSHSTWTYLGNVFGSGPTGARTQTFGSVKVGAR